MKIKLQWDDLLRTRLREKRPLIQILIGPRQVGKTTSLLDLKDLAPTSFIYGSADDRQLEDSLWIRQLWQQARKVQDGLHAPLV
jgi:uncharacterized protein